MANAAFGELSPNLVIQEDTRACLSACLLSQIDPSYGISEEDITRALSEDGLHEEGIGADLFYSRVFDNSIRKIGLDASAVYDGRLFDEAEDPSNEEARIIERLAKIETAIRDGQSVLMAFPKRRESQAAFSHYVIATGYEETKTGSGVVILDPSDVDGGIRHPSWEELQQYVTPTSNCPVMAWGISKLQEDIAETSHRTSEQRGFPGFRLMAQPMYREEDTGKAIPTDTDHPSSVVMPTSYISRQYNEYGGIVLSSDGEHPIGYPRFVVPPAVKDLALASTGHFDSLPFPTRQAAEATLHPEKTYGDIHKTKNPDPNTVVITEKDGLFWLSGTHFNLDSWQNIGLGISTRQAAAIMEGRPENDLELRNAAEQKIKTLIEKHTDARPEDIYLFPTGMAALYWLNRAMISFSDSLPGAQFGFPYTDTYDLRKFGPGRDVRTNILDFRDGDYGRLQQTIDSGQRLRGVITEYPTNPLLWTPDFARLDHSLDGTTPIIIDDTIGTMFNLDDNKLPENVAARATSLTKFVSSVGDAMGGSIVLRPNSPHYEQFKAALDGLYQDTLWYEDAERLASNSDLFEVVMPTINQNANELARWLNEEWAGEGRALHDVYYPSLTSKRAYDAVKKNEGGYSGVMSLRFNDPKRGYRFFDKLEVTKGPSLGTYYTLASLYTLMAHKILGAVEKFGVTPDLVRLSVGIEDIDDLKDRFERAFRSS
jgi:cystathionine gamma-synthase